MVISESTIDPEMVKRAWGVIPEGELTVFEGRHMLRDKKMRLVVSGDPGEVWKQTPELGIHVYPRPEHIEHFVKATKGVQHGGPSSVSPGAVGTLRLYVYAENPKAMDIRGIQSHFRVMPRPVSRYLGILQNEKTDVNSEKTKRRLDALEKQIGKSFQLADRHTLKQLRGLRKNITSTQKTRANYPGQTRELDWLIKTRQSGVASYYLRRGLSGEYMGWVQRALRAAIDISYKNGSRLYIPENICQKQYGPESKPSKSWVLKQIIEVCKKERQRVTLEKVPRTRTLVIRPKPSIHKPR